MLQKYSLLRRRNGGKFSIEKQELRKYSSIRGRMEEWLLLRRWHKGNVLCSGEKRVEKD
jgi:hypothetical protein